MAWAGAGGQLEVWRRVRRKLGGGGVELVDHDAVGAEVVDEDETVGLALSQRRGRVGLAGATALGPWPVRLELRDRARRAGRRARSSYREDFAAAVAGGDDGLAGAVHRSVDEVKLGHVDGVDELEVAEARTW